MTIRNLNGWILAVLGFSVYDVKCFYDRLKQWERTGTGSVFKLTDFTLNFESLASCRFNVDDEVGKSSPKIERDTY